MTYLGQTSADRTGLLGTEVKGQVLLVLVELPEVLPLLLVHDGQYPRDRLADGIAAYHSKNEMETCRMIQGERTSW